MKNSLKPRELGIILGGSVLFSAALNIFIVPLGLYNGGVVGISQLLRTALLANGLSFSFDIAGIINFILNLPLFVLAYRSLSKKFLFGTLLSLIAQTIAFSLIPIPAAPILSDPLSSCVIGGILSGIGAGIVLITGTSAGGVDILGVYAAMKYKDFSVGKLGLGINAVIYLICALVFDIPTALYSIIYAVIYSAAMDKVHLQNIEVSLMIFTKNPEIRSAIMKEFVRGVTYWKGQGAFTNSETEVLVTIISKYELDRVRKRIRELDPHAFVIVNEGLKVSGGYEKRLL